MEDENKQAVQAYAAAGVNIETADMVKKIIKRYAHSTFNSKVLSEVGYFGGLFQLDGFREPVLVASVDGVGTKLKIASVMGKHDTVGVDLVNHCVNDILTCGAKPLFFLDYIATGKLSLEQVESIVSGLAVACQATGCALIGGETAEMPGFYTGEDYDLAGFIVGGVEKKAIIDGSSIEIGNSIIGLPSSGLHTNGYSLVRSIFGESPSALGTFYPELGRTLGEELLEPHRCYYPLLNPVLPLIKGMAHITGGGLIDNVPRILPPGLAAEFHSGAWPILPIFNLIQERGNIDKDEMFHVFNMGVGMVLICSPGSTDKIIHLIPDVKLIGEVVEQKGEARVTMSEIL